GVDVRWKKHSGSALGWNSNSVTDSSKSKRCGNNSSCDFPVTQSFTITGLEPSTTYDVQVRGWIQQAIKYITTIDFSIYLFSS
ncbi:MAG: hypothetical protein ACP5US_11175, partial [Candidatus Kryptoniota bacterium]